MLTVYISLEEQLLIRSKQKYIFKNLYNSKENNTKIQYENESVEKLGMGDPTTCVDQLIYDKNDSDDTNIIQYFIINGLGLCIKVDIYVAYMFYAWSFSHNTAVTISTNKNKYILSLKTKTTAFSW